MADEPRGDHADVVRVGSPPTGARPIEFDLSAQALQWIAFWSMSDAC